MLQVIFVAVSLAMVNSMHIWPCEPQIPGHCDQFLRNRGGLSSNLNSFSNVGSFANGFNGLGNGQVFFDGQGDGIVGDVGFTGGSTLGLSSGIGKNVGFSRGIGSSIGLSNGFDGDFGLSTGLGKSGLGTFTTQSRIGGLKRSFSPVRSLNLGSVGKIGAVRRISGGY